MLYISDVRTDKFQKNVRIGAVAHLYHVMSFPSLMCRLLRKLRVKEFVSHPASQYTPACLSLLRSEKAVDLRWIYITLDLGIGGIPSLGVRGVRCLDSWSDYGRIQSSLRQRIVATI
ncbi:hypothetical protein A0H81_00465 [Grifola frondosa]|uniref:Uncharacterized protein n=1 Tax=Grifola frondosa TaxID=5627 RepID=A0A1C7MSX8_GRIFR|nr:hypothetical protein A0H81_00465 [Grifola frondosa]